MVRDFDPQEYRRQPGAHPSAPTEAERAMTRNALRLEGAKKTEEMRKCRRLSELLGREGSSATSSTSSASSASSVDSWETWDDESAATLETEE